MRAVAAWSKIGWRHTGYERHTRSAVWSCSNFQRQPASPAFPDFFCEWCAVALFRRPTNETRLLCTSNGALLTLGVHNKRAAHAATLWNQPSSNNDNNNNNNWLAVARRWTRGDDRSKEHLCSLLYSPQLLSNIVYTARRKKRIFEYQIWYSNSTQYSNIRLRPYPGLQVTELYSRTFTLEITDSLFRCCSIISYNLASNSLWATSEFM
jgi:hypothetical protein